MYRTLGTILVALTVATAAAQKPVQLIEVEKCETMEFSVVDWPGDRYTWDLYRDSTVNYAKAKGDVVITMDADLQDSPDEIPELFRLITEDNYDF